MTKKIALDVFLHTNNQQLHDGKVSASRSKKIF